MTSTTFIKVAAASAAVGLLLTACAGSSPEATTVTVTATATETEQARPAPEENETDTLSESEKDEQYVLLVSSKVNTYGIQESTLAELGRTVCATLDKDIDVETIYMLAKSNGLSDDEAAAIIAAAIVVYCPWNESMV